MANIRTIALNGAETKVEIAGQNCAVRNDGTETVYASRRTGIIAGADGVLAVPAGQSAVLRDTCGTLYLLGTGSVQLVGADYDSLPFKTVSATGGSGADEVARAAISAHAGNAEVHVTTDEKSAWNAKAELSDIPTSLPANGGNADTLGSIPASELERVTSVIASGTLENGISFAALDTGEGDTHIRAQINSNLNRLTLYKTTDNWKTQTTIPLTAEYQTEFFLEDGTDVLAYITSDFCPSKANTIVRIMNSPTCPTNYGYSASDNDFSYDIFKLDNYYSRVKAYDVRSNVEFINGCFAGVWSGWIRSADGGNAASLGGYHVVDGNDLYSPADSDGGQIGIGSFYQDNLNHGFVDVVGKDRRRMRMHLTAHADALPRFYKYEPTTDTWSEISVASAANANYLENHPASDFVLKSEYDALAARVAALEGGA